MTKNKDDLISRKALKKALDRVQYTQEFCIEHQIDYSISMQMLRLVIDNAPTVERPQDNITEEDIQNAIKAGYENGYSMAQAKYQRPQGEWLFTEIYENYHVYGQCSICKERNRIGKACRSCGAEMVTYTGKDRDTKGGKEK